VSLGRLLPDRAPRTYWALLVGAFTNNFGNFVLPFLFVYVVRKGVPPSLAGLPIAGFGAGAVIAAVLGGVVADRWGCRWTVTASMVGSASAMLALAALSSLSLLTLTATAAGLFANLYRPAVAALVADLASSANRATMYASYRLAINLGMAIGVGLAGLLAGRTFILLFIGDAASSLVFAALAAVALPAYGSPSRWTARPGEDRGVVRDRPFLLFLLAGAIVWLVHYQLSFGLPLRVGELGYPTYVLGALVSFSAALVLLVELPITYFTQSLPRGPTIAAGALLIGSGFALLGTADRWWTLALCVVVLTAGEILVAPLAAAYVMDVSPAPARGRYQGAWSLTRSIGMLGAPALGGLAVAVAPWLLWVCCAAGGVVPAGMFLVAARWSARR